MRNAGHIVLVGPMGSGKSTLGRGLATRLGLAFVDVDARIAAEAGCDIPAIFTNEGEPGFRARESQALAAVLAGDPAVIATGGGAVLADANCNAMRDAGVVIYLQVDPATQLARLAGDTGRPLLATPDRARRLADLQAIRGPLYRAVAHRLFDSSALSPDAAVAALANLLATPEASCK
ncbi:shikimate kinase [Thermomonas carbonis]|uniref:shikimate kinase n=1 Tax=Thermomonas carbonis TaxID=1463158 RepID=UPI0019A8AA1D|nr:shikimate kinase [Thermomonas carbonis]GHB99440.1 shikimate kinase [Thermomonas carbonis]